jgi:hypothetical protein
LRAFKKQFSKLKDECCWTLTNGWWENKGKIGKNGRYKKEIQIYLKNSNSNVIKAVIPNIVN